MLYPLSYGGSSVPRVSADAVHYCPTREWFGPIPARRHGARTRVLVVDDDPMIRHLITVNLELEGFEVGHADDGESCLRAVEAAAP